MDRLKKQSPATLMMNVDLNSPKGVLLAKNAIDSYGPKHQYKL